jgi:surface protein
MPRIASTSSRGLTRIGLKRITVTLPEFYYPLTNTSTDPTSANWRNNYAPAGYTFVPNDGIYTQGPITNMREMFSSDGSLQFNDPDISTWDVSTVTNMLSMFFSLQTLTQSLNSWDVSNVTNMGSMFRATFNYNQPLNNWNVSNVTNMSGMFDSTGFNQDISMWDVSSVTSMNTMFAFSSFNQPIGSWDVSNVTNMDNMFLGTPFSQDLSSWCVTNITQEPPDFSNTTGVNPVWGTCPSVWLDGQDWQGGGSTTWSNGSFGPGNVLKIITQSDNAMAALLRTVSSGDEFDIEAFVTTVEFYTLTLTSTFTETNIGDGLLQFVATVEETSSGWAQLINSITYRSVA